MQDLEDEIGVDLLRRSPRGVTLTAEGKLFLEEVRELLSAPMNRWKKSARWLAANMASCMSATSSSHGGDIATGARSVSKSRAAREGGAARPLKR